MGLLKIGVELVSAVAAGLGIRYAYQRFTGTPAPAVAPANPLPPVGVLPTSAPTVAQGVVAAITGSSSNVVTQLPGNVTDTLQPTGLDVTTGGDIGGLTGTNTTAASTTPTTTSDQDTSTVDDSTLAGLDAALASL